MHSPTGNCTYYCCTQVKKKKSQFFWKSNSPFYHSDKTSSSKIHAFPHFFPVTFLPTLVNFIKCSIKTNKIMKNIPFLAASVDFLFFFRKSSSAGGLTTFHIHQNHLYLFQVVDDRTDHHCQLYF